jgi:hypothetical protein
MGSAAYSDFIVRKDALGILLLVACLAVCETTWREFTKLIILNFVAVVAILSHESFFFFGLPILIVLIWKPVGATLPAISRAGLIAVLKLFPAIAAFGLTVIFHGNATVAEAINQSWRDLWFSIEPQKCCFDKPAAAIDGLQWGASGAIAYTKGVLGVFSYGVYVPLAWLVTICVCFLLMGNCLERTPSADSGFINNAVLLQQKKIIRILVFQFIAVCPLFVIGWDFGRWIFLWSNSSLAIYVAKVEPKLPYIGYLERISDRLLHSWLGRLRPKACHILFFAVPSCCWTVYNFCVLSPAGYIVKTLAKLPP